MIAHRIPFNRAHVWGNERRCMARKGRHLVGRNLQRLCEHGTHRGPLDYLVHPRAGWRRSGWRSGLRTGASPRRSSCGAPDRCSPTSGRYTFNLDERQLERLIRPLHCAGVGYDRLRDGRHPGSRSPAHRRRGGGQRPGTLRSPSREGSRHARRPRHRRSDVTDDTLLDCVRVPCRPGASPILGAMRSRMPELMQTAVGAAWRTGTPRDRGTLG
jgi:hypothetical protein